MKTFLKVLMIIILAAGMYFAIEYIPMGNGSETGTASSQSPDSVATPVPNGIIINEVMSNNKGIYPDDKGNNSDWAEIYNSTDSDVSLQNYALSDDTKNPAKWPFPNISIKAHGYLVIFLSGDSSSDLQNGFIHCSFKLSSKGEKLLLTESSGVLIDSVDIPSLGPNVSYGIVDGKWQTLNSPTPGFENSDAGFSAFRESMTVKNPPVLITEVMPKNRATIKDAQGEYADWVEVTNISKDSVDLNGFGLSDNLNNPLKWKFPDVTLKSGETRIVFCTGSETADSSGKELDADFKLSSTSTVVTLSDQRGRLMDSVQVSGLTADWSYERTYQNGAPSGNWQATSQPSPGYPNTSGGFEDFLKNNPINIEDIVISEVLTSNNKYDIEKDGKSYDYIEIENRGQSAVNLKGYGLTNNASNPAKFLFPDVTIQPGKQLLVLATGLSADQSKGLKDLSAPFKLSRLGDVVSLFNANGDVLDRYFIGTMLQNYSIGREEGKSELYYFDTPTPGSANGTGYAGITQDVSFSQQAGKYDSAVQVSLSSSDGSVIYYTTNGDTPTNSSTKYTGPITVDKTTAIRAKAFKNGFIDSGVSTATYFIGAKHTLPLISIVTDDKNLNDPNTGIFQLGPNAQIIPGNTNPPHYQVANYLLRGKQSERPASFEVFDNNGKESFEQNVTIRVQGGFSRDNQQKSLSIFARSSVGPSTMKYKFFEDLPYTEYKSIQLRDGGQADLYAKINEAVVLGLVKGKGLKVLTQDIKPYVVYINGQYWGVYYMEEKRNQHFVTQHNGISDNSNINLLIGAGTSSDSPHLKNGTNSGYKALLNYVQTNDMTQKASFDYVASQFDTDSYMDEMINEIYIANSDYFNMEFYQAQGGKWEQIFYDFCWTLRDPTHATLSLRMSSTSRAAALRYMFDGLLQYGPWKEAFLKRFAWTMENIYPTQRVLDMIDQQANLIASEMPAEHAKFTDESSNWDNQVNTLRTFAKQRPYNMLQQLKSVFALSGSQLRGYFDFSDANLKKALNLTDSQFSSIFG